jgi:hypothetical protein
VAVTQLDDWRGRRPSISRLQAAAVPAQHLTDIDNQSSSYSTMFVLVFATIGVAALGSSWGVSHLIDVLQDKWSHQTSEPLLLSVPDPARLPRTTVLATSRPPTGSTLPLWQSTRPSTDQGRSHALLVQRRDGGSLPHHEQANIENRPSNVVRSGPYHHRTPNRVAEPQRTARRSVLAPRAAKDRQYIDKTPDSGSTLLSFRHISPLKIPDLNSIDRELGPIRKVVQPSADGAQIIFDIASDLRFRLDAFPRLSPADKSTPFHSAGLDKFSIVGLVATAQKVPFSLNQVSSYRRPTGDAVGDLAAERERIDRKLASPHDDADGGDHALEPVAPTLPLDPISPSQIAPSQGMMKASATPARPNSSIPLPSIRPAESAPTGTGMRKRPPLGAQTEIGAVAVEANGAADPVPSSPLPIDPITRYEQTSRGVQFTVRTVINGAAAGTLNLLIEHAMIKHPELASSDFSVRLADLVALFKPRMTSASFATLMAAVSANSYVTLNDLRARGISVKFDHHDRLAFKLV